MVNPYIVKEQYIYTESVVYDEDGNEVARFRNCDDYWYDTESSEEITPDELEDYR